MLSPRPKPQSAVLYVENTNDQIDAAIKASSLASPQPAFWSLDTFKFMAACTALYSTHHVYMYVLIWFSAAFADYPWWRNVMHVHILHFSRILPPTAPLQESIGIVGYLKLAKYDKSHGFALEYRIEDGLGMAVIDGVNVSEAGRADDLLAFWYRSCGRVPSMV